MIENRIVSVKLNCDSSLILNTILVVEIIDACFHGTPFSYRCFVHGHQEAHFSLGMAVFSPLERARRYRLARRRNQRMTHMFKGQCGRRTAASVLVDSSRTNFTALPQTTSLL